MHPLLRIASMTVLLMLTTPVHAASENKPSGKIIKWVDENGVTHYGDTIPPQYSGKRNTTISPRGIPQADTRLKPAEAASGKESEQSRRDRTLQSVYSTEQEIDLARDRNLQMDEAMLEGLEQRKLGAATRLQTLRQNEGSFKSRNKAVPDELKKDIKDANLEIVKIDEQIVERKQHMDTTRQRFENDKRRFNELRNGSEAGAESGRIAPPAAPAQPGSHPASAPVPRR